MQSAYFSVPTSPQNDKPDHIAERSFACVPYTHELFVGKNATSLPILSRSRITFQRIVFKISVGRSHAPFEENSERTKRMKLLAGSIGKSFKLIVYIGVGNFGEKFPLKAREARCEQAPCFML